MSLVTTEDSGFPDPNTWVSRPDAEFQKDTGERIKALETTVSNFKWLIWMALLAMAVGVGVATLILEAVTR